MGLIGALFEALAAMVIGIGYLLSLLAESLGFAGRHLSTEPAEGESRFSGKRLAVAFAPILSVIVLIPCVFVFAEWRLAVQKKKREETLVIMEGVADTIVQERDPAGRVIWPTECEIPDEDSWGNPYQVKFEEHPVHETLTMISFGPDSQPGGLDDVVVRRRVLLPKRELGRKAVEAIRDEIMGKLGGDKK